MFERLLVPLDTSPRAEAAIAHVLAMALVRPVTVTLLHVLEPSVGGAGWDPLGYDLERGRVDAYLMAVADRLAPEVASVRVEVLDGRAAEVIARCAVDGHHDLLVLSEHGHGGPDGTGLGSVTHKLFSRASISVLLARTGRAPPTDSAGRAIYRLILAPLDGSQRAEYALTAAGPIARAHEARLHICHVLTAPDLLASTLRSRSAQRHLTQVLEVNRAESEAYVTEIARRLTAEGVEAQAVVHGGPDAPEHIHDALGHEDADLVVVCAHGASGAGDLPYGRAVQTLARFGTVPLLVVQDVETSAFAAAAARAPDQRPGH